MPHLHFVPSCTKKTLCALRAQKQPAPVHVSARVVRHPWNQVNSFSFSLSVTFHPAISMSLTYKYSTSPSGVSKSSSVTCVTSQISLSSPAHSSSSVSSSSPASFSTILARLAVFCLARLSSSCYRASLTRFSIFSHTRPNTVTLLAR